MFYRKLFNFYFLILIFTSSVASFASSKFYYAEQWYVIFSAQMKRSPDSYTKNIFLLQKALKHPFGNPEYSLAKIETREQWNKYKLLFKMHVNLLLVKQNLYLGDLFDTRNVYFFRAPEKEGILKNLEKAKNLYQIAASYYNEALKYHKELKTYMFINIPSDGITNWEDEYYRIEAKELDYFDIIEKELMRIERTKEIFTQMKNYY